MGIGNQETTTNNKVRAMEKNIHARSCQLKHPCCNQCREISFSVINETHYNLSQKRHNWEYVKPLYHIPCAFKKLQPTKHGKSV